MATTISVPGGSGVPPLVFTVTGTSTTNYALAFQNTLNAAGSANTLTIDVLSSGVAQSNVSGSTLNEIFSNGDGSSGYDLTYGGEYTLALVGSATTVTGSGTGNDTVVAGGDVTFIAAAGGENVDFISGTNVFDGGSETGDTITGGAGYDTINTATGNSTVFSGAGNTLINLNDTAGGDIAYLGDGHATVNADGVNDTVTAGTNGQTIFGGSGLLTVSIIDNSVSSGPAGDVIVAGASTATVFDSVGGNSIFGGSGSLTFVGEVGSTPVADSILAGSGGTTIFGADSNDIAFASAPGSGSIVVVAGDGNETLNGANAGDFSFFASSDTSSSASISTQVIGGTGSDYFSTGAGTEDYFAGTGVDVFALNTVGGSGASITINDFSAADSVSVDAANMDAANNGTLVNGNYTITLSDDTTVTFVGVTSLSGHII